MLTEPTGTEVKTPHPKSRTEAWLAFRSAQLDKYSKIRDKLKKKADKETAKFYDVLYSDELHYFVIETRPRRREIKVELLDGTFEWVKVEQYVTWLSVKDYRIRPEHTQYVVRQEYLLALGIDAREGNEFVFTDKVHEFELTGADRDEYIAERLRQEGLWRMENLRRKINNAVNDSKWRYRLEKQSDLTHDQFSRKGVKRWT